MASTVTIPVTQEGPLAAARDFLTRLLADADVAAVLTPCHLFGRGAPMPCLVADPARLDTADPFSPAFPMNGAKLASRLTRGGGETVAAVMRPCEIRAFVELVKLNQGSREDLFIVGVDCLGAMDNAAYAALAREGATEALSEAFLKDPGARDLAKACQACEHPAPEGADLVLGLHGGDPFQGLWLMAESPRGEALIAGLGYAPAEPPQGRAAALETLTAEREAFRDAMFAATEAETDSLEKLAAYLGACVNCYNCRVACPVCYCRECVFTTDVFDHKPWQYLGWAERKGGLKLPSDTVFYHLTRLAHMSTACVGCGQCSNACPNGVPVMELFRSVAAATQKAFDYRPGRSLEEAPPMTVFREDEFREAVSHLA